MYRIIGFAKDEIIDLRALVYANEEQALDSIVAHSPSEGIAFNILEQDEARKPGQVEGFIPRYGGPGVQRLDFLVDDIVSAVHEFREQGSAG
jgi:4-hydroxymandelate synthase